MSSRCERSRLPTCRLGSWDQHAAAGVLHAGNTLSTAACRTSHLPGKTGYTLTRTPNEHLYHSRVIVISFHLFIPASSFCDSKFVGADLIHRSLEKIRGLGLHHSEVGHNLISQRKTTTRRHHDFGFLPTFSLLSCTFVPLLSIRISIFRAALLKC